MGKKEYRPYYFQETELIPNRIPKDQVQLGRAYIIHARNGGVGIAVMEMDKLNYTIHRNKFGSTYLFNEEDWEEGPPFGTAIPMRLLEEIPPDNQEEWLAWLISLEEIYQEEIKKTWGPYAK